MALEIYGIVFCAWRIIVSALIGRPAAHLLRANPTGLVLLPHTSTQSVCYRWSSLLHWNATCQTRLHWLVSFPFSCLFSYESIEKIPQILSAFPSVEYIISTNMVYQVEHKSLNRNFPETAISSAVEKKTCLNGTQWFLKMYSVFKILETGLPQQGCSLVH